MISIEEALSKYNDLIAANKSTKRIKWKTEQHHIKPRAHGGSDEKDNLVILFHKDHFLAHYYLWIIHRDEPMTTAFFRMFNQKKNMIDEETIISYSEDYQVVKEQFVKNKTGKEKTPQQCQNIKDGRAKGKKGGWEKGKKRGPLPQKQKEDLSKFWKGREAPNKGKKWSAESIAKRENTRKQNRSANIENATSPL